MSGIGGRYPGGPSREADGEEASRPEADLTSAEEIEDRSAHRYRERKRRRRRRRVLAGFVAAFLVAGGVGFWLGWQSHRTSEELAREEERTDDPALDLAGERDKVLQQLWLMEDLEAARQRR